MLPTPVGSLRSLLTITIACSPNNDVKLATVAESPVLQREGYTQNEFEKSGNPVPTMEGETCSIHFASTCADTRMVEWTFAKQKWQRAKNVARGDVNHKTAQILPGFREKVYD